MPEETTEQLEQTEVTEKSSEDDALDTILGDGSNESSGPSRDEKGRFASKDAEEPEDSEPKKDAEPEGYGKALAALKRDGVPDSVLDSMDPKEISQWGARRAKNQADVDGYGQKVAELEKQLAEARETKSKPVDSKAEPQDLDVDELVKPLAEEYGEELSEPLKAAFVTLIERFGSNGSNDMVEQMAKRLEGIETDAARSQLRERFPQLDLDDGHQRVLKAMEKLNPEAFDSLSDKYANAAWLEFGNELLSARTEAKEKKNRLKSQGQPQSQSGPTRKQNWKELSGEEREDAYLDKMLADAED
jgi:hypothetical protein